MDIVIRAASEKDIPNILELLYDLGRPKPKDDSDVNLFWYMIKRYIKDSDKEILVATHGEKIIGMVSLNFLARLNQNRPELYIPELIVSAEYQRSGIGRELIGSCIKIGNEKKCHRIRLESGNARKDSHEFYKKIGFEQSGLSFTKTL